MKPGKSRKLLLLNLGFLIVAAAVVVFLLLAPDETTAPLPIDPIHQPFHQIADRKEAEQHCLDCHGPDGEAPLSANHPSPYRCLFCHKRDQPIASP
jgi:cytochrome c553